MGFLNSALSWAVLGIGLLVPAIAVLEVEGMTTLTRLELERHGMTKAESTAALRPVWRFAVVGLVGALMFGFGCWAARTGHGNAALALGVSGIALWRSAAARADERADRARRAARAAAAAASLAAEGVAPQVTGDR
jgi:hypothetical protein